MKNIVKYIAALFFLTYGCVETIPEVSQERSLNLSRLGDLVQVPGVVDISIPVNIPISMTAPECGLSREYLSFNAKNAFFRGNRTIDYSIEPQIHYLDYPMRNANGTWNVYQERGNFISFALDAQQAGCNIGNMVVVYKFQDLVSGNPANGTYETRIVSVREHLTP